MSFSFFYLCLIGLLTFLSYCFSVSSSSSRPTFKVPEFVLNSVQFGNVDVIAVKGCVHFDEKTGVIRFLLTFTQVLTFTLVNGKRSIRNIRQSDE